MVESTHPACGSILTPCARFVQRVCHDDRRWFRLLGKFPTQDASQRIDVVQERSLAVCRSLGFHRITTVGQLHTKLALVSLGGQRFASRFERSVRDGTTGLPQQPYKFVGRLPLPTTCNEVREVSSSMRSPAPSGPQVGQSCFGRTTSTSSPQRLNRSRFRVTQANRVEGSTAANFSPTFTATTTIIEEYFPR
jgi:hypothetical protein